MARPGHFDGVATVCAKLFNLTRPARAYFGQKDAVQCAVIRQLVRDLDFDMQVVVVETLRAQDGLALSSRNAYLNTEERAVAPVRLWMFWRPRRIGRLPRAARGERGLAQPQGPRECFLIAFTGNKVPARLLADATRKVL